MAVIQRQTLNESGGSVTTRAAAAGDTLNYNPGDTLLIHNTTTAAITVTVTSRVTARPGVAPANLAISVPAGAIGYFTPSDLFRDANGVVALTYSATAGVNVAVIGR